MRPASALGLVEPEALRRLSRVFDRLVAEPGLAVLTGVLDLADTAVRPTTLYRMLAA